MKRIAVACALFVVAGFARADESKITLGPRFSGPYEVSFQPFEDAKRLDRQSTDEVIRYSRDDKNWTLEFDRIELPGDSSLKDHPDAHGVMQAGYLSAAINKLRASNASADVLRQEVIDLGELQVGVIVARTVLANKPVLLQEALIEAHPQLYYSIVMTSPAASEKVQQTPEMTDAADTFKAIIDSIESVDLSQMREDQDERLFRTRALFVGWNKAKLLAILQPEHFLRFKKDGKDIGYGYVVEQPADALPKAGEIAKNAVIDPDQATGIRVGIRTRTITPDGKTLDTENWMFVTFDRRHEVWSDISVVNDPNAKSEKLKQVWYSEVGASDQQTDRVFDNTLKSDDYKEMDDANRKSGDKSALPYHEATKYMLTVRDEGRSAVAQPLQRELPPFYLPQALAALLPRLLPQNTPDGYLFATYSGDSRQVMLRYVDVLSERDVKLDDQVVRAIPITDKLGFGGVPTTDYVSPSGEYLGAINDVGKIEITPTDRDTLLKIWKDANLTQPGDVKE